MSNYLGQSTHACIFVLFFQKKFKSYENELKEYFLDLMK